MLGAVPVVGLDVDEDDPLHDRPVVARDERSGRVGPLLGPGRTGAAQDLQPAPGRVVDEEQRDPVVVVEVSGGDVLLVAPVVGEAEGLVVQGPQEAARRGAGCRASPRS